MRRVGTTIAAIVSIIPTVAEAIWMPTHVDWAVGGVHLADRPAEAFAALSKQGYALQSGTAGYQRYGRYVDQDTKPLDGLVRDPKMNQAVFKLQEQTITLGFRRTLDGPHVYVVAYKAPSQVRPIEEAVRTLTGRFGPPTASNEGSYPPRYTWCVRPTIDCTSVTDNIQDGLSETLSVQQSLDNGGNGYLININLDIGIRGMREWDKDITSADAAAARTKSGNAY